MFEAQAAAHPPGARPWCSRTRPSAMPNSTRAPTVSRTCCAARGIGAGAHRRDGAAALARPGGGPPGDPQGRRRLRAARPQPHWPGAAPSCSQEAAPRRGAHAHGAAAGAGRGARTASRSTPMPTPRWRAIAAPVRRPRGRRRPPTRAPPPTSSTPRAPPARPRAWWCRMRGLGQPRRGACERLAIAPAARVLQFCSLRLRRLGAGPAHGLPRRRRAGGGRARCTLLGERPAPPLLIEARPSSHALLPPARRCSTLPPERAAAALRALRDRRRGVCPRRRWRALAARRGAAMVNAYGPTETVPTLRELSARDRRRLASAPDRPADLRTRASTCSTPRCGPVPLGVAGELYIARRRRGARLPEPRRR